MVQDPQLARAVAAIPQRSERQPNLQKLVGAFVDVGILPQVQNANNQVICGRRGTGKTHVLRVLGSNLQWRALGDDFRTLILTGGLPDLLSHPSQ